MLLNIIYVIAIIIFLFVILTILIIFKASSDADDHVINIFYQKKINKKE